MANKKISALPLAASVTGPDLIAVVSGGATKRATMNAVQTFCAVTGPTGPAGVGEHYEASSAPASGSTGATWFNPNTGEFYIRSAGSWLKVGQTS